MGRFRVEGFGLQVVGLRVFRAQSFRFGSQCSVVEYRIRASHVGCLVRDSLSQASYGLWLLAPMLWQPQACQVPDVVHTSEPRVAFHGPPLLL